MTREEYKKNLIRMFDSLRDEFTGEENCAGIDCGDCPFYLKVCGNGKLKYNVYESIEIVEQWAKEHQIVTNAMKFKEVFGIEPETRACVIPPKRCENCEYYIPDVKECGVQAKFWNAEYKPTKEGEKNVV